jgi:alpha-mannosidase
MHLKISADINKFYLDVSEVFDLGNKYRIYLVGNAHLDPVWLWRWQEGFQEIKATFRSALDRMDEFPEFIFTCACASYYKWVENNCPEMFEEIKQRVKEGRWVITGGWWVQPDCNIPSGESYARHALYSQRYFLDKFEVMAKVGYNVDSFGHNGMLPQILKKSGLDYYVFMRPGDEEKKLPGNLFWWESEDGSQVLTFKIPYSYGQWYGNDNGSSVELQKLIDTEKLVKEQCFDFMGFYGVGNHGGGPTIANLNMIRQLQKEWDNVILIHSSPNQYFDDISKQELCLPVVKDDLQHHASGCYSAHSETKENNRRSEHQLVTAEKFASVANILLNLPYPKDRLTKAWQNVLFNQFHDIMGGCSVKEAYQDARISYGEALNIAGETLNAALQKISWSIDTMKNEKINLSKEKDWALWEAGDMGVPLVVFNPHSWELNTPIQVNKLVKGITDEKGNALEVQVVRGSQTNIGSRPEVKDKWDTLFLGRIPPLGYRVYWIYRDKEFGASGGRTSFKVQDTVLENEYVRLEIEPDKGYIKSLFDKKNKLQVLNGCGAIPVVIDESHCDTWAHGVFEFHNEVGRFENAKVILLEKGPLRSRLRITSEFHDSVLRQEFIMYRDRPDIEVRVKLDWREKHKMLKLSFPLNIKNPQAVYEIPYGFIGREADGKEQPGQRWLDVSGEHTEGEGIRYGLAVINDSKYSYDVKCSDLRLTVVRSPIYADHFGERDEYCEFMDQGTHEFKYLIVPHTSEWRDAGLIRKAFELNDPPIQIIETYHKGIMPEKLEGIKISCDNVVVSVFKEAEDGNGFILRCFETLGRETTGSIEIPILNRKWIAKFGKCEIKTFRISKYNEEIVETNLIEL